MNTLADRDLPMILDRPLVFFDLETTGLDTQRDRIVEFAAYRRELDGKVTRYSKLVNPEQHIAREASLKSGIYDDDVAAAPTFVEIAHEVNDLFRAATPAGHYITGFDLPMLAAEFKRADVDFAGAGAWALDTKLLFFGMEPFSAASHSLAFAHEFYLSRTIEGAHRAMADVTATRAVLWAMVDRYEWHDKTPAQVAELACADYADARGILRRRDGELVVAVGVHKGKTLRQIGELAPDYIRWLKMGGISDEVAGLVAKVFA